ncbi:IS3 family transposase [Streptomyces sp. NPDC018964]|uniref:IS3 family transposase n=1 Tax=unclassified Streptomyces TaxID=2593676 RepID=UPI0037ADDDF9
MARPSPYPLELCRRVVRMVAEVRPDHDTEWAAMKAVASKPGIGTTETLRTWVRQDRTDAGTRPGTTTEESAELKRLKKENAELKERINEIFETNHRVHGARMTWRELNRQGHTESRCTGRRVIITLPGGRTGRAPGPRRPRLRRRRPGPGLAGGVAGWPAGGRREGGPAAA